jgi:hypothetical protein
MRRPGGTSSNVRADLQEFFGASLNQKLRLLYTKKDCAVAHREG